MSNLLSAAQHQDLQQALLVLRQGGVVAFPTETYYGLAVDPFNSQALERLFQMKRRPAEKPILVLIDSQEHLPLLASEVPNQFHALMDRFWPGPLTLIFPAQPHLSPVLTAGTGTIGLRISSHPLARSLTALSAGAITATSANISGRPPAVTEQEVLAQFGHDLDWLLKAGSTAGGTASTIIAADQGGLRLVRQGVIPFSEVEKA
jgi:L-threonylcarbamoyladenylate synthase